MTLEDELRDLLLSFKLDKKFVDDVVGFKNLKPSELKEYLMTKGGVKNEAEAQFIATEYELLLMKHMKEVIWVETTRVKVRGRGKTTTEEVELKPNLTVGLIREMLGFKKGEMIAIVNGKICTKESREVVPGDKVEFIPNLAGG